MKVNSVFYIYTIHYYVQFPVSNMIILSYTPNHTHRLSDSFLRGIM